MSEHGSHGSVLAANQEVHSRLAASYAAQEPHYRPENVARVSAILDAVAAEAGSARQLDIGCGVGFMIDIGRTRFAQITGVDATREMAERVDRSGPAQVDVLVADINDFAPDAGAYDVVTAYSFLHHLFEPQRAFELAARALKPGGVFYADLDPNKDFWDGVARLPRDGEHRPAVQRELDALLGRDAEIAAEIGVEAGTFDLAEWGKNIAGGFAADQLTEALRSAGFERIDVLYSWFVGQAAIVNDPGLERPQALERATHVDAALQAALPLSRGLFKYIGFVARRA